jgi:hypothetical protein
MLLTAALFSSLIFAVHCNKLFPGTIQAASPAFSVDISYYLPEGIAYDPNRDRIILASLSVGYIYAFPNSKSDLGSLSASDATQIYGGSINGISTPVAGIKVYGDTLYAAVGAFPPLSSPFYGGMLIINLLNTSDVKLVDFSSLYDNKPMVPNDVVYSSYANAIFITDFVGFRIFKYDLATMVSYFLSLSLSVSLSLCWPLLTSLLSLF